MISLSPRPWQRPASAPPMDFRFPAAAYAPTCRSIMLISNLEAPKTCGVVCSASKTRGFGPEPVEKGKSNNMKVPKEGMRAASKSSKLLSGGPKTRTQQAPQFTSVIDKKSSNVVLDREFLEKVEAVKRSALEQKKAGEEKNNQAIDYDAPVQSEQSTIGLGTKVGVGIAVVVFGLVFAFGDFIPSGSVGPSDDAITVEKKITEKEKAALQSTLQQFEATLDKFPNDPTALEGAAVTSTELGEYERASSLLEKLVKERPTDIDAYRLLGEVKYMLKDYEGSASAYRSSLSVSDGIDFEVLRGLTNSLLAANKPMEINLFNRLYYVSWLLQLKDSYGAQAVQVLLSSREHLNDGNINRPDVFMDSSGNADKKMEKVDPIQVELLLGKAYSDWGHVSDAVAVYDQLISKHPNDFRGYLAKVFHVHDNFGGFLNSITNKGIILKENGKGGDAERMFIQARFFAPERAKALVDRYAGR